MYAILGVFCLAPLYPPVIQPTVYKHKSAILSIVGGSQLEKYFPPSNLNILAGHLFKPFHSMGSDKNLPKYVQNLGLTTSTHYDGVHAYFTYLQR